jgi:glycosyltransferase involved in cell wall biosynthesis
MNIVFVILTYNRPQIASYCIQTLLNNTNVKPRECWILDDGSKPEMRNNLFSFTSEWTGKIGFPIHLILSGKNRGIGYNFEMAYNIMKQSENDDIFCFIEADYIWRKGWLEDVVAVFEASPHTVAIAGTDHPDMYDRVKTHTEFPKLMVSQFGEDLKSREHLYDPFDLETSIGKIKVQGVSNSCGCQFVHWGRMKEILKNLNAESEYWDYMEMAFHKKGSDLDRRYASDAHMSGTLSKLAEKEMLRKMVDISKNFGFLSICDYSISSHRCGQGINGMVPGIKEGDTFIHSPAWKNEYLSNDPRAKIN